MIMGRFSARAMSLGAACGLASIVTVGGALLGAVEGVGSPSGMWLVFNSVTTTGFGTGPLTTAGQWLVIGLFVPAVSCWFCLVVGAIEIGTLRFQKHSLIDEALRPVARRSRDRLFHVN